MPSTDPNAPEIRRATLAILAVFFLTGFVMAAWFSRIPALRDHLGLSPLELSKIILIGAFGSLVSLPLSGRVCQRWGNRNAMRAGLLVLGAGMGGVVLAYELVWPLLVAVSLFGAMMGTGLLDASMNVEGGLVEQLSRHSLMPKLHGMYSAGTVVASIFGAGAAAAGISLPVHLGVVIVVVVAGVWGLTGYALPLSLYQHLRCAEDLSDGGRAEVPAKAVGSRWGAWGEKRTLLLGVMILGVSLAEGAASDWVALAVVDGFGSSGAMGASALAAFMGAMTVVRLSGSGLLHRYSRTFVLRLGAASAILGLALFALSPWLGLAMLGALAWGFGVALGFPIGMSAASDRLDRAPARVSVVATIGYGAYFIGPPIVGAIAELVGYRLALLCLLLPMAIVLFLAPIAEAEAGD